MRLAALWRSDSLRAPEKKLIEIFDVANRQKLTAFERLRRFALSYPEAHEDHPWGETTIKVRGKVFVFIGADGLTVKLPRSFEFALEYPGTKPAGYGLGKSGWVSSGFGRGNTPPLDVLEHWIAESYSAVAPKKLNAAMETGAKPGKSR